MRTTVTLEPEVERAIRERAHRSRRSFKAVINELLKRALRSPGQAREPTFRVVPHKTKLVPGIDAARFNQLADELEDEARVARVKGR